MRVFFLPGAYDGCYYYRGYLPGNYGDMTVVSNFASKQYSPQELLELAKDADTIIFQRPNDPLRLESIKILKAMGKKVIVENDDTYLPGKGVPLHMLGNDKQRKIAKTMDRCIKESIKIADGVIASTEKLAEEFRQIRPDVHVLKNTIDPLDEYECLPNDTGKYRVAFVGSVASNGDYEHIKDQIKKLDERGDTTIILFGLRQHKTGKVLDAYQKDYEFWDSLKNIEWQSYVPIHFYYHTLSQLKIDLAIIPRQPSYFNQCKSNLKFLEMSLLKIPVIAQGFEGGPYEQDKDYLKLIYDNNLWYDEIVKLLENKSLRGEMGNSAHDYVLKNYNINDYAPIWRKTIEEICK